MAYICPRCGEPVQRGYSSSAAMAGGLVGALFVAAFGPFQCKKCGKIKRGEFPPQDRTKMTMMSVLMIAVAVGLLGLCLWLVTLY